MFVQPEINQLRCSLTYKIAHVYTVYMKHASTAEHILSAARAIFEAEGAEAVSMRRVADAVGITAMAIYRHFPNRDALLKRIYDDNFSEIARHWEARSHNEGVIKRLIALQELYLDYALAHPYLFDHAFSVRREGARQFPEDFRNRLSPTLNVIVDAVADGMQGKVCATAIHGTSR